MRTGILHRMRVRKRLCVSVLGGKQSIYFSRFQKHFGNFGVFVKQIVILNIGSGLCVFNSIWEHRLKTFFDPQKRKNRPPPKNRKLSQKCEQFSYETFGGIFLGFLVPLHSR